MQPTRQGYIARQIPCQFSSCGRWFKSAAGLKIHLHSVHSHDSNISNDTEQPLPPDVVQEYHEKSNGLSSSLVLTVIKSHSTGKICDANGMDLPEGTPPLPHTPQGQDDWTHIRTGSSLKPPSTSFPKCRHQQVKSIIYFTYGVYHLHPMGMTHHLQITKTSMKPSTRPQ